MYKHLISLSISKVENQFKVYFFSSGHVVQFGILPQKKLAITDLRCLDHLALARAESCFSSVSFVIKFVMQIVKRKALFQFILVYYSTKNTSDMGRTLYPINFVMYTI